MRAQLNQFDLFDARRVTVIANQLYHIQNRAAGKVPYLVLADPAATVSATYGVAFQANVPGSCGWANRPARFVIDHEGVVRFADDSPEPEFAQVLHDLVEQRALIEDLTEAEIHTDTDRTLRDAAIVALSPIGRRTKSAIGVLAMALEHKNADVRAGAAAGLFWLAYEAESVVSRLAKAVLDSDVRVRRLAAATLGRIGGPSLTALPSLLTAVSDENERVRRAALFALDRIGPSAKGGIRQALADKDPSLRAAAVAALPQFHAEATSVVRAVVTALEDDDQRVRFEAARALCELPVESESMRQAVPALVEALGHPEASVRAQAAKSLQAVGRNAAEAVPVVLSTLKDTDAQVREQAAKALRIIGPAAEIALPVFVKLADDEDVRLAAIRGLWPLANAGDGVQRVVDVLATKLDDHHQKVRWQAAQGLFRIGSPAKTKLIATLEDADLEVRFHAANALASIGPDAAVAATALAELVQSDPEPQVRARACWALGKIKALEKTPVIVEAFQDSSARTRQFSAWSLETIGPEAMSAVPALIKLLDDEDDLVRARAESALKVIDPTLELDSGD